MCEPNPNNVTSFEEISFKLTDQHLPSFRNSKQIIMPMEPSLQYTISRVSIGELLPIDPTVQEIAERIDESQVWKNSSLKSTSFNSTTLASLKNTPRSRITPPKEKESLGQRQMHTRKMSQKLLSFDLQPSTARKSTIHSCGGTPRGQVRLNSARGKAPKGRTNATSRKGSNQNHLSRQLKGSLVVRRMDLKQDEQKQKKYLKCILQNRKGVFGTGNWTEKLPPIMSEFALGNY